MNENAYAASSDVIRVPTVMAIETIALLSR
jgi:hypothetical protein